MRELGHNGSNTHRARLHLHSAILMRALGCHNLFDGQQWHQQAALLLEGEQIACICSLDELPEQALLQDLGPGYLVPGLIDLQVNGGGGLMLNGAPTSATLETMALAHRASGTTAILPTVISDHREVHRAALEAVVEIRAAGHAGILGLHIEGPFFAAAKRGAHSADMIRCIEQEDIDWLCEQAPRLPLLLTLAPEQCQPGQIAQLVDAGIHVCAGHSEASYEQAAAALTEGLAGFTHLFNAMSQLQAREPGLVGAALDDENSWVGIIADGHHVHPASIRVAQQAKAQGRLYLVSDAMATVGAQRGDFEIYGETIRMQDGRLVNSEGNLAGSAIGLIDAVRFCVEVVGLSLEESLRMASLYPAGFLEQPQLGHLRPGARADLLHLDPELNVCSSWLAGHAMTHV